MCVCVCVCNILACIFSIWSRLELMTAVAAVAAFAQQKPTVDEGQDRSSPKWRIKREEGGQVVG